MEAAIEIKQRREGPVPSPTPHLGYVSQDQGVIAAIEDRGNRTVQVVTMTRPLGNLRIIRRRFSSLIASLVIAPPHRPRGAGQTEAVAQWPGQVTGEQSRPRVTPTAT